MDILNLELCKERSYVSPKLIVQGQLLIFGFIRQLQSNLIPADIFQICYCFHQSHPNTVKFTQSSAAEKKKFKKKIGVSLSTQMCILYSNDQRKKSLKLSCDKRFIDFVSCKAFNFIFAKLWHFAIVKEISKSNLVFTASDFMVLFENIVEMYQLSYRITGSVHHQHLAMWILHNYGCILSKQKVCFIDPNDVYDGPVLSGLVSAKCFYQADKDTIAQCLKKWIVQYRDCNGQSAAYLHAHAK